jgi:hypothetical protein
MVRSAITDMHLKVQSKLSFLSDDEFLSSITMGGWILRSRLISGLEADMANRAWEYESTITSGGYEDLNLRTFAGLDIGGGAGSDGLGQTLALGEIVTLIIEHVSGDGSLEIMGEDPANRLSWVPAFKVSDGNALKAGGVMVMHQPAAESFDDVTINSEILRIGANGGDVTFHVYLIGRHDADVSSSSSSSSSQTSRTSTSSSCSSISESSSSSSSSSSTPSSLSSLSSTSESSPSSVSSLSLSSSSTSGAGTSESSSSSSTAAQTTSSSSTSSTEAQTTSSSSCSTTELMTTSSTTLSSSELRTTSSSSTQSTEVMSTSSTVAQTTSSTIAQTTSSTIAQTTSSSTIDAWLLSQYFDLAETWGEFHYNARTGMTSGQAKTYTSEWYDMPHAMHQMSQHVSDPRVAGHMKALGKEAVDIVSADAALNPTYNFQGWRSYIWGLMNYANDETGYTTLAEREGYRHAASSVAYWNPFGRPYRMHPDYESWPLWSGTVFSREFALSVMCHLHARTLLKPDNAFLSDPEDRDALLTNCVDKMLDAHIPNWLSMYETNTLPDDDGYIWYPDVSTDLLVKCDFLPFMFTHTARVLIEYYEDQFDSSRNIKIKNSIAELMEMGWVEGYREADGEFGIYYHPGNKTPAPDLSLFIMPSYAWLYSVTGEQKWYDRSVILIESGVRWAYLYGLKQYDQSYMWSYQGLQYLGLV